MRKIYTIGKYGQGIESEDGKIVKAICTCMWGSLHSDNFNDGGTICKHIKEALIKFKDDNREKQKTTN